MEDFLDRFAQTNSNGEKAFSVVREGLVVGLLSIGTLFGAIVGRYFSDYLGRRKAIAIFCGMFSVGVLIQGELRSGRGLVPSPVLVWSGVVWVLTPCLSSSHYTYQSTRNPRSPTRPRVVTAFTSWVQIMMGRFISGWGVGGLSAAVPVYQAESVPKQVRGACTSTYQLAITLGSKSGVGYGVEIDIEILKKKRTSGADVHTMGRDGLT
jgi:SP family sugar:H+ symporter-like MFS transporter